jgi:hypothetical protein
MRHEPHVPAARADAVLACSCVRQGGARAAHGAAAGGLADPARSEAIEPVFAITEVASLHEPWALAFLPDGRCWSPKSAAR